MTPFTEQTILGNKYLHVIAYMDNYIVGYNTLTSRAYYITEQFSSDLIVEMPDDYQNWAMPILETLNYRVVTQDNNDYYEILVPKVINQS